MPSLPRPSVTRRDRLVDRRLTPTVVLAAVSFVPATRLTSPGALVPGVLLVWCLSGGAVITGVVLARGASRIREHRGTLTVRAVADQVPTTGVVLRGGETVVVLCNTVVLVWLATGVVRAVAGVGTLIVAVGVVFGAVGGTIVSVAVILRVVVESVALNE
ncbi:hypothetical protein GRX01_10900 [Halobaculum sp. WSA2]|uniref:Uncharacterized protein n=1 Tax=Halobaculum saliterrae TaxID=2073113 RepID=A0A6B0SZ78_9EURY|nr:hypothetical protein [Halobaculum saliterrae]MXR41841.1 hypothetical protein [Halobaculum saliterrae]